MWVCIGFDCFTVLAPTASNHFMFSQCTYPTTSLNRKYSALLYKCGHCLHVCCCSISSNITQCQQLSRHWQRVQVWKVLCDIRHDICTILLSEAFTQGERIQFVNMMADDTPPKHHKHAVPYDVNKTIVNDNMHNFSVINVAADGVAPLGARPSAGTEMTLFASLMYTGPTL